MLSENTTYSKTIFSVRSLILFLGLLVSFTVSGSNSYEVGDFRVFDNNDFYIPKPEASFDPPEIPELPDSIQELANHIHALADMVAEEGRFIDRLDALYEVTYPIGISRNIGGQMYTIVLDSDEITPEGAFLNAYMSFPIPQTGRQLAFYANKIPLTAEGGINGVVELGLMFDEPIKISDDSRLILYGGKNSSGQMKTRVRFDCNGFVDMAVDAGIEFSPNVFVVENPTTGKQTTDQLTAQFTTTIQSWSDMIVEVSLPPFQIKELKGFGFEVQQASFDFSDISNPAGITFPPNYTGLEAYGELPQLWQGFYFRQLVLRLPPELKDGPRMEIMAQNLIIDEVGVSGSFAANNLLDLKDGTIGGWAFSIDKVELDLVASSITKAGMNGKITMPIMDSTEHMSYSALVDQHGEFMFNASMPKDLEVPMFSGKMTILNTSSLTIQKEDDKYAVLATLNGKISISSEIGEGEEPPPTSSEPKKGFSVDDLAFEGMQIGSMDPYFRLGVWSLGEVGYSSMKGFSLVFSNIESFDLGDDVGVKFTTTVKLSGDKYVASTTLKVIATKYRELRGGAERQKLKYKKTELQDLYISINDAAISLEGYLAIFDQDPIYGDGYAGMVKADIIGKFGVQVKACFGEVDNYKYWYVDALANFQGAPIPISPGISLYGIGGGAYHHMSQKSPTGIPFSDANITQAKNVINYEPDQAVFLGFKATVALGTPSPQGFNAVATFEIVFNQNWGVNEVMFYGQGSFMQSMNLDSPTSTAPIQADVYIGMDFVNDVFYGNFKVYVNACNGLLTGANAGNLAGEMVIYADPVDWYIHIGRPSARVGLKFEVFGLTVQNGSYFMMGTQIEEMPPPPEEVLRILDIPMPANRNEGEIRMAKGFAFGTYFSISTGDKNFGIFYASFDMGVGFDVMLSDMGETYCVETGEIIGMNGWYAQGQLYAFLEGSIGIDINVFSVNIHQGIVDFAGAILFEAKLPNPFWMRGIVGGEYSLLGGRVEGNCRFELEMGDQCTLLTVEQEEVSPVKGLTVISELSPGDGRSAIDVFTTPQVVFNYQIGKTFSISDEPDNSEKYNIILDYFTVTAGGQPIPGEFEWNTRADVVVFNPHDILPGNTNITLKAGVHFEKYSAGHWETIQEGGVDITEVMTAVFETGEAPSYIPESNVVHSYPLANMMNLYKNEFSAGHIQLNFGQEYLFQLDPTDWVQYGRFTPMTGGEPVYVEFTYNPGEKKVNHIIPSSLGLNKVYRFELISVPASAASGIDANIVQQNQTNSDESGDMTFTGNIAESVRDELQEEVIYTCHFRTSIFGSLREKIESIQKAYTVANNAGFSPLVFNLNTLLILSEPFDKYELEGTESFEPLLKMWALTESTWLKDRQIPFIYEGYPLIPAATIKHRDTTDLGFIPVRDVFIDSYTEPLRLLNDEEKQSGITNFTSIPTYVNYQLSPETWFDYQDIAAAVSLAPGYSHPRKTELLSGTYPALTVYTAYPVQVQYSLPFDNRTGTQNTINIEF